MATKQPSTLVEALNAFQKEHHAAGKDGTNPFFKSKYTTLAQALLAIQPATEFGLCHTQLNDYVITPDGEVITIVKRWLWSFIFMKISSSYPSDKTPFINF